MTDDDMTNTLAVPEEAALAAAAQEDTDDPSMRAKIELPCWDRLNDSKIIREVSEVFKGFELPNEEACSKQFADADALAEYVDATNNEIKEFDAKSAIVTIRTSAAIAVRKWAMGRILENVLTKRDFGSAAMQTIAKATGTSMSTLYHIRRVAKVLSMKEVYVLGMYDAGWFNIRSLAFVPDQEARERLIAAYTDSITDWNDAKKRDRARTTLHQAIQAIQNSNYDELATSDPDKLALVTDHSEDAPEFTATRTLIDKLGRMFSKASSATVIDEWCRILDDYFIMDDIPSAETLNGVVVEQAADLLSKLNALQDNLPRLIQSVESVSRASVTQAEQ